MGIVCDVWRRGAGRGTVTTIRDFAGRGHSFEASQSSRQSRRDKASLFFGNERLEIVHGETKVQANDLHHKLFKVHTYN